MCKRPEVSGQGGGWGSQANGRGGYVKDQGSHHWRSGAIQDTRGLITGEGGLYKIPGLSSLGRGGI